MASAEAVDAISSLLKLLTNEHATHSRPKLGAQNISDCLGDYQKKQHMSRIYWTVLEILQTTGSMRRFQWNCMTLPRLPISTLTRW